jgi:Holliday junction DNA helicase RuvB
MKQEDLELVQGIAAFERSHDMEKEYSIGWGWRDVRVWPATLNRLFKEGYLENIFRSNSYTGYRLSEKGWAVVKGSEASEAESHEAPVELPDDLFADIIGHDEVKELLRAALEAPRPVHVLLSGPPALAKSLFLWDMERAYGERALWVLGSAVSRSGLQDEVAQRHPRVLLVDELEKASREDLAVLLSLMEGGRLRRVKVGRGLDEMVDIWVVAATNAINRLAAELLSRFAVRELHSYNSKEFRQVVLTLLQRREGCDEAMARDIALRLDGRTQDVRDAVRVARLAPKLGVDRAISLLLP